MSEKVKELKNKQLKLTHFFNKRSKTETNANIHKNKNKFYRKVKVKKYGCVSCRKCTEFECYATGQTFKIKQKVDCCSNWVIYIVSCELCRVQYVGSCINIKSRLSKHKSDIRVGFSIYSNFTLLTLL